MGHFQNFKTVIYCTSQSMVSISMESLQRQHRAVANAGDTAGGSLYEVYPGMAAAGTGGRSRAEVAAELREAQRSGVLRAPTYWGND